jgi:hypothetical protein
MPKKAILIGGAMKMTLEFDDREDMELYSHALGYYITFTEIMNKIRSQLKYTELSESASKELEDLQKFAYELSQDYHLPQI